MIRGAVWGCSLVPKIHAYIPNTTLTVYIHGSHPYMNIPRVNQRMTALTEYYLFLKVNCHIHLFSLYIIYCIFDSVTPTTFCASNHSLSLTAIAIPYTLYTSWQLNLWLLPLQHHYPHPSLLKQNLSLKLQKSHRDSRALSIQKL